VRIVVVGGGIAGALISFRLAEAGVKVLLFDDNKQGASGIAAGFYNTITGIRAAKTWRAEELIDSINQFRAQYPILERYFHSQFVYRPFKNLYELNEWSVRAGTSDFSFVEFHKEPLPQIVNPWGGILVKNTGWLEVAPFVQALKSIIGQKINSSIYLIALRPDQILPEKSIIHLEGANLSYDYLIFANGIDTISHPLWHNLPLIPLKGELAYFELAQPLLIPYLISAQYFILPLSMQRLVVGATYERNKADPLPTTVALQKFQTFLNDILALPITFRCYRHLAGVRPSTPDRRPIIGRHPIFSNIFIFNGLGTKGVLLAFYFSDMLTQVLLKNAPIEKEVDLLRFVR
jgi:glycine/D-amino acid oxidase-like deaminating enzyme